MPTKTITLNCQNVNKRDETKILLVQAMHSDRNLKFLNFQENQAKDFPAAQKAMM